MTQRREWCMPGAHAVGVLLLRRFPSTLHMQLHIALDVRCAASQRPCFLQVAAKERLEPRASHSQVVFAAKYDGAIRVCNTE